MTKFLNQVFKFLIFILFVWITGIALVGISTRFTKILEKYSFGLTDHNGHSYQRSTEFNNWVKTEKRKLGVIIGSSTAFRNIIPDTFNTKETSWFNLGSSLQTPRNTMIILDYITEVYKIDFVLLDYYPNIELFSDFESSMDLVKNSTFSNAIKIEIIKKSDYDFRLLNQFLYRLFKNTLNMKTYLKNESWSGEYAGLGFVSMDSKIPICASKFKGSPKKIKESEKLKDIINLLNDRNIPLVINIAPCLGFKYSLHSFFPLEKKIYLSEIFNNPKIDSFFYDTHHMTLKGAKQYSSSIKMELNKAITP
jgi:hypothetical protein